MSKEEPTSPRIPTRRQAQRFRIRNRISQGLSDEELINEELRRAEADHPAVENQSLEDRRRQLLFLFEIRDELKEIIHQERQFVRLQRGEEPQPRPEPQYRQPEPDPWADVVPPQRFARIPRGEGEMPDAQRTNVTVAATNAYWDFQRRAAQALARGQDPVEIQQELDTISDRQYHRAQDRVMLMTGRRPTPEQSQEFWNINTNQRLGAREVLAHIIRERAEEAAERERLTTPGRWPVAARDLIPETEINFLRTFDQAQRRFRARLTPEQLAAAPPPIDVHLMIRQRLNRIYLDIHLGLRGEIPFVGQTPTDLEQQRQNPHRRRGAIGEDVEPGLTGEDLPAEPGQAEDAPEPEGAQGPAEANGEN